MANYGEGTIEILLEDFWEYVFKYCDNKTSEIVYGVPRINKDNNTIEIDYLFNTDFHPTDQSDYKESKVAKQWQELKSIE